MAEEAPPVDAEVDVEVDAVEDVADAGKYYYLTNLSVSTCELIIFFVRSHSGGRGGMKGGAKVVIEAHRHEGVFIARGKEDALVTLNSTPGKDVYGEKRIQVEGPAGPDGNPIKLEYRVWNPFRSKIAAAILGGIDNIHIAPGKKVHTYCTV